jgi:hypothetical protein
MRKGRDRRFLVVAGVTAHCHYCGLPVRTRVFVESYDLDDARARHAARVAGIAVCSAHVDLVLRDPVHHPHMRRWTPPTATDAA